MGEISKLELRIKNSEKWNTKELRITIEDAKLLLKEINEIKVASTATMVPIVNDIQVNNSGISGVDGGSFSS